MDTKLKKTHKLATILITLSVLLPAFLLTALYPRIGEVVQKKVAEYEAKNETLREQYEASGDNSDDWHTTGWTLRTNFVNYAVESSFYLYGNLLEQTGETVDYRVFEQYGWKNDFERVQDETRYHAQYDTGNGIVEKKNAEVLNEDDTLGYLTLKFDSYGYLSTVTLENHTDVDFLYEGYNLQTKARESIEQYKSNVTVYEKNYDTEVDAFQLIPKNFTIRFALDTDSDFVYVSSQEHIAGYYYWSPEREAVKSGAIWMIAFGAIFVALMALILPFVKPLNTGREKLFSIPFELVVCIGVAGVFGFVLMFSVMSWTCAYDHYWEIEILGYEVTKMAQHILLLIANFLGWAFLYFIEYIVVACLRQFFSEPKYYIKNRIVCINFLRWLKRKIVKIYRWAITIDVTRKLHVSILKIVGVNLAVLFVLHTVAILLGSMFAYYYEDMYRAWICGVIGILIYSIVLYCILRKYGVKLQRQYSSLLYATQQMAEGNLKIGMEENLGLFMPISQSLSKVQQGFQQAVAEEAKSQSMKTELITNVSHDLKTPLTAIITYVELLKREDITEEERKSYVQTLDQKSQRLKVLIEDLFEVSKAHSGNVTMNFMDVDVVSLMKQVRLEMADQMEASNLTFRFNLPEEKVVLSLDGQRTYRVFENLLGNALKYAMPYSRVYVDIHNTDCEVKVVFRNMSAQELNYEPERLTERFVRGDASRQSEGSGLGLAIAKSFVELQNGKLNIEVDGDLFKVVITWNK